VQLEASVQMLSNGAVLAVVRDLGARAAYERTIQASEAKLRSILHTAPDVIMTVDRLGKIVFINRTLPPHTVEQVVGTSCYDYVPPSSRPRVQQAIEQVFSTRDVDAYEVEGPSDPDGKPRWSSVRVGPLIQGEQVVGATLCATDVTERKRDEARARELLDRLAKIARQVPGVVYQYQLRPDGSACFPYASERIREIYRVAPEEVRDDATKMFTALHPDDHANVVDALARSAKTLEPWQQEYRVRFASDDERWLFGSAVPERQSDGSTLWHGFVTDVTEHKRTEQARAKLEEQRGSRLQQSAHHRRRFRRARTGGAAAQSAGARVPGRRAGRHRARRFADAATLGVRTQEDRAASRGEPQRDPRPHGADDRPAGG
jgi:PAS domain S-box-containing protein